MNIVQAEENLKNITTKFSKDTFIFDLLSAYNFPKATISKLKIKNKNFDDVVIPAKLHFVGVAKKELDSKFDELVKKYSVAKKAPRFIIVTDYQNLKAYDIKVAEKLDTEIKNLPKHPDFFLPWVGIEKKVFQGENPADVKAAEKLAKFFDLMLKDNLKLVEKNRHALNVFLTRILFCFFAEDTDIFKKGLFTESLASHTRTDGSDLDDYLQRLFELLNKKSRASLPDYLKEFPYVNGGLFAEEFPIPKFSKKSRESLIDLGSDLNWAEINPDIFGSMIQAVVHPDQRSGLGMHYTSVTNIMKVIEPLFLAELKEEFVLSKGNKNRLKKLLERIGSIRIFDPACGSGNFLIIAYKELRLLEMDILKGLGEIPMSGITLSNFYGIEIDDFAHEVAKLSLWLAEHQMNVLFNKHFGDVKASLPLKDSGRIVCENAVRGNWSSICPVRDEEIYILGNPPYLGARNQTQDHKSDLELVFRKDEIYKDSDYVSAWFIKAAEFLENKNGEAAFVSTNSITQGEQVCIIWPLLFARKMAITFAHKSFKWTNNARDKAVVSCVIIGFSQKKKSKKILYEENVSKIVTNISPYLTEGTDTIVYSSKIPINGMPKAVMGNMARDGGNLILSPEEKIDLIKKHPESKNLIKKFMGAQEFIDGKERWCLWITDDSLKVAISIPEIKKRIDAVYKFRKASKAKTTNGYASIPHKFAQRCVNKGTSILIPKTTSDRREYIPFGFFDESVIVSDLVHAVFDVETWIFGLLSSKMHMSWVSVVAGRLGTGFRYSAEVCYNTFPVPLITENDKKIISSLSFEIVKIREKYFSVSIGDLYDPDKMPHELLQAHRILDKAVDKLYREKDFKTNNERIDFLFSLYEKSVRTK